MERINSEKLAQIKKELKEESTRDIFAVLCAVQAIERALQQELKRRS